MITIIDYGMGNLHSVFKALKRMNIKSIISSKSSDIESADKLILPGVGHFKKGMENLKSLGIIGILNKKVITEKTPILGICLGMQLLTKHSEEGDVFGLGWIDAKTIKFNLDTKFRSPHMGWNTIKIQKENLLLKNNSEEDIFYFVHSYYINCKNKKDILATTNYGCEFVSAIQKNNIYATQFHPEKSHSLGLQVIKNFVSL